MQSEEETMDAPPKQLANALEGLTRAIRLIADVRSGADLLLEACDLSDSLRGNQDPSRSLQLVSFSVESTKRSLDQLRSTARELETSGVLIGAQQRYQDNQPLGIHQVPLVCPDGALVAYSWKRQIAGQAAASAVDRTRLALKAFREQKNRFLAHIDSEEELSSTQQQNSTLSSTLKRVQETTPGMTITPLLRSSIQAPSSSLQDAAMLLVLVPGVFKAIVSLLPAGSTEPDAIAVYSPDENQSDPWGASAYHTYQKISDIATNALHNFVRANRTSPLLTLLQWLYGYRSLLSKPCRQCKRLLALDPHFNLLLPPIHRPFRGVKESSKVDEDVAYHSGCIQAARDWS